MLLLLALIPAAPAAPAWKDGAGHRQAPLTVPQGTHAGFTLTDPQSTGLAFTNTIPESRHLTNQVLLNGSGLATGDVDGDGQVDLFCAGFDNDNALFRNLGGWKFEEVGTNSGVALPGLDCTGAAFADLDGDGDLDLVVNTLGQGTVVLFNDGHGHFTRSTQVLNPGRAGMTVSIADYDGDGRPDLYIANYRTRALMDMPATRMTFKKVGGRTIVETVNGRPATDPEFADRFVINEQGGIEENGEPDVLYRNVDGHRFEEVPWTGGAFLDESGQPLKAPPRDWGLAAMFHDLNNDGRPDLYVCNDFQSPDRLWLNLGGGKFRLAPALALRRTSLSSMAVDFADINRDGIDDFVVLEMLSRDHRARMRWVRESFPHRPVIGRFDDRPQLEQNTLQLGRGDGTWAEVAQLSGLEAAEWAWSCAFLDVDLDGWPDLLVVNGMERAARDLDVAERLKAARAGKRMTESEIFQARRMFPRLATANLAFRNQGDLTFRETGKEWGFDLPAISQSIALADLDGDGDLDVVVGNLNAGIAVYRNNAPAARLAVRLAGRLPNTRGLGARIQVDDAAPALSSAVRLAPQCAEMTAGGRYLAGDDPMRTFATGTATQLVIRVSWPSGAQSEVTGIAPNSLVEVSEPAAPSTAGRSATPSPAQHATNAAFAGFRFEDATAALGHQHFENAFDDFAREPLLPVKLSQPGPGLAWVDLDGDGRDDLIIGAGNGGSVAACRNLGGGRFAPWDDAALRVPLPRDATALVGWPLPRSATHSGILIAQPNYEDGAALGAAVLAWDPANNSLEEVVPASESSPGPLALADVDGDGDLDLFVGGRVIPGRWPAAAASRFFRNDGGRLVPDIERSRGLENLGRVTGAVFTDLDGDGKPDLALACEWGPVRVLHNEGTVFKDVTTAVGLDRYPGLWNSVAAGDFDNDGRMDLVAGNWGRNTPYERFRAAGDLQIYHGDFNGDGVYDVLEAHVESDGRVVPDQPLTVLAPALPFLREQFPTHASFGEATVAQVLGQALASASVEHVNSFETTVLLNRGTKFEPHPLPIEAQFAPVFGISIADADGDGNEDLFLAQNFFAVRPHTPRYDAGTGLWLKGDGHGGFAAVPGITSGVQVFGEQRGTAVADFDGDGRVDLAVGQNGAATRLFRNLGARPGVQVRLKGPPGNPSAVGARLRWKDGTTPTPAPIREVHSGSGYLSQDSMTPVLARPGGAATLVVSWPGGLRSEHPITPEATQVTLSVPGPEARR